MAVPPSGGGEHAIGIGAIVPHREAGVLTEPCNFPDKRCNLADNGTTSWLWPSKNGLKMFQFEGYTLDVARSSLRTADRDIQLRPKSFEVLRYLVENADRLVTKEELIKALWPNVVVTDKSLAHCVSEVRQALGDSKQTIIATMARRGYRFAAPVLRVATVRQPALPTAEW